MLMGSFSLLTYCNLICSCLIVCRFVNQKGEIMERLLDVEHVLDTTSASLKRYLDAMFVG